MNDPPILDQELLAPLENPGQLQHQAGSDPEIIELWLHGRSIHTQRAYRKDAWQFLEFVRAPLNQTKLRDLQDFSDSLEHLAPASRLRTLNAVKSLMTFGQKIGYLRFNVGAALEMPQAKDTLAERILPQEAILAMIHGERKPRNHVMLRLLYVAGLRVSELCGLCWRDVQPKEESGQITVFGKGGKTRAVLLTQPCWETLMSIHPPEAGPDEPVFRSQMGGALDPSQVRRVVYAAAKHAGIQAHPSPHWFRHAHASHALDHGAPIHLVQATLGHSSVATTGRYLHVRPSESSSKYIEA